MSVPEIVCYPFDDIHVDDLESIVKCFLDQVT